MKNITFAVALVFLSITAYGSDIPVESVTLDIESMYVLTNSKGKLNATITPDDASVKDVVFTSNNPNVVEINPATGEFVAGPMKGIVTITCTAQDGSGEYAECVITVMSSFVPVTSVTLDNTVAYLEVGKTFQLNATISPGSATYKNIIWRSSNENVATVSNGNVTAVAPGVATITAISGDGQARANCVVTVYYNGDRIIAEIQGDFSNTSSEDKPLAISKPIPVNKVIFKRSFKAGIPATIMLPFNFTLDASIGSFYTIESVAKNDNGEWIATPKVVTGTLQANTPYIFKAANDLTELSFEDEDKDDDEVGITLQPTSDIKENPNGDWTLHGVYQKTMLDGDGEFNYGFAGKDVTADGISVGDFIRAGEGVWADPMRCYLTYKKGELTKAATVLPDRIRVVFPDEVNSNNEITDIIENTETEDVVTPVSEISPESGVKVWSYDGTIYIEAQPDMDYTIVDLSGRTIKQGVTHSTHEEVTLNAKGIVIVKIGNKTYKLR